MFYVTSFYDIKIHDGWLHKILIVLFWKLHKRGPLAAVQQEQSIVSRYGKAIILLKMLNWKWVDCLKRIVTFIR